MSKLFSWRPVAAGLVLFVTIFVFAAYFANHPEVGRELGRLPLYTLLIIFGLYLLFIGSLAMVNAATLRLCSSRMPRRESVLLTMYSSVINFFGPLQSGPAFRGVYLKQKYGIKFRNYTMASFVYYFFYALFSVLLLLSGLLGWWLAPLGLLALFIAAKGKDSGLSPLKGFNELDLKYWRFMALAALTQVSILVAIFWLELNSVATVSLSQAAIYTGAANLALFVSFTPGAIGFRESFLVFTQNLHHIGNSTIVAANIIDRSIYVAMLAVLSIYIFTAHVNRRFNRTAESPQP